MRVVLFIGVWAHVVETKETEWAAKVSGVSNLRGAVVGTIGPGKGGKSVGGIGCLADDTSNS